MKNSQFTQKEALKILSEKRVAVICFDKKTGRRESQYGGLNLLSAIQHISIHQKEYDILICDGAMVNRWEINFKTRINIVTAIKMTIRLDLF